jgi:integrase
VTVAALVRAGAPAAGGGWAGDDPLQQVDRLRALLEERFLAEAGWDGEQRVLSLPADHPLLGRPVCRAPGCGNTARNPVRVCDRCAGRLAAAGLSAPAVDRTGPGTGDDGGAGTAADTAGWPELTASKKVDPGPCLVAGCGQLWATSRECLCRNHSHQRRVTLKVPLEVFLADPRVTALPACPPCSVPACLRQCLTMSGPYCNAHKQRWRIARLGDPGLDEQRWRRQASAVSQPGLLSLRGLPDLLVAQLLLGLQERTRTGRMTIEEHVRLVITGALSAGAGSLTDLAAAPLKAQRTGVSGAGAGGHGPVAAAGGASPPGWGQTQRSLVASMLTHLRRLFDSPEVERGKDMWRLSVFGAKGWVRFTGISQPWLRATAKAWAVEDLAHRRGNRIGDGLGVRMRCVERLSTSLAQRPDAGLVPTALGRADIENLLHRLAFEQSLGRLSLDGRRRICQNLKTFLGRVRSSGLTRAGQPAAGLGEDFVIIQVDVPAAVDREPNRDLPAEILAQLCQHLPALQDTAGSTARAAIELLIDTGRRPEEIGGLGFDCLARDNDANPVLVYDNAKANRLGRRLPIGAATAAVIVAQQQRVRAAYPHTPIAELKLLPARWHNREGRDPIGVGGLNHRHRQWVTGLPVLRTSDGVEFDKTRIVPYAYRHSYAQRHADAGVPVDVLRELMDHRVMDTTKQYYRVGQARRREAVDRLVALQFDRHGNRIWRQAKALLDSEHARRAIGEVVVPFGVCAEPSNVAAAGHACPYRFRCAGCDHFRTDVSYLPDLQTYLDDLLRAREKLLATQQAPDAEPGIDDWARIEATPSQEEITRIRRLIDRITGDLAALTPTERAQVEQAITTVRRHRAVMLGLPRVRQPQPDVRPPGTPTVNVQALA